MNVLETARKILLLEQREGFRDRTVVGGLDGFLEQVKSVALPTLEEPDRRHLQEVIHPLDGYSHASQRDREAMLAAALAALGRAVVDRREDVRGPESGVRSPDLAPVAAPKPPRTRKRPTESAGRLPTPDSSLLSLDTPVERVPGVSAGLAPRLKKLGIATAGNLLEHYPFRHIDRSSFTPIGELRAGEEATILGTIWDIHSERRRGRMVTTTATVADKSGSVVATWFNQPYLTKTLRQHSEVLLSGKVELFRGRPQLRAPDWELLTEDDPLHAGRIVPVYHLTEGLNQRALRRLMKRAVDAFSDLLDDFLPEDVRRTANLMGLAEATRQYHFPDSWDACRQAHRRLAFDELFLIQLTALHRRRLWQEGQPGVALAAEAGWLERVTGQLPFELTDAQRKVLADVLADVSSGRPMNRLIQGDVGSGKTVVAALAMLLAAQQGYQSVLMAPTEILAEQHFRSVGGMFDQLAGGAFQAPRVALLTGSVKGKTRKDVQDGLKAGAISAAVGTQALIQEGVALHRLALAVVDEQHRFGVEQRGSLRQKGFNPHLLVMTATPIPRTLGLTIYGDLDISTIDEMPPGRQPVKTKWFGPEERQRAYSFIRRQVHEGRQAFVICPLVEESEKMEVRAATAEYERLRRLVFPEFNLGLLHGRLKNREKDEVMRAFSHGQVQILVSTSVVEVGIDVPNATVMAIEGAERFGLAQLHQFRGRVGRGEHQSYCMLLSDSPAQELNPRLRAIEETHSGFRLAEIDLELRGPGELFGTRQSGLLELKVAKLTDSELIEESRRLAGDLLEGDPELAGLPGLRGQMGNFWQGTEVS
ncbi:MAG TPA: ATP-dependent DNA helicase RecG [Chloroflexota bacterium]